MAKKIEDFFVGQKAELVHRITREDVRRFIELTGDDNPLHADEKYAARSSFKGIVTHGMLSASFISTLVGKKIPGEGALWMSQSMQFLLPVRLDDELRFVAEVTQISVREKMLSLHTEVFNQYGQRVLTGRRTGEVA
jgi:3-oxoacyl-[acyl-carrier protein] reductase